MDRGRQRPARPRTQVSLCKVTAVDKSISPVATSSFILVVDFRHFLQPEFSRPPCSYQNQHPALRSLAVDTADTPATFWCDNSSPLQSVDLLHRVVIATTREDVSRS